MLRAEILASTSFPECSFEPQVFQISLPIIVITYINSLTLYMFFVGIHIFSGLCGGKWSQQLCSQWPVFDLLWLLPRPFWRRVSSFFVHFVLFYWEKISAKINMCLSSVSPACSIHNHKLKSPYNSSRLQFTVVLRTFKIPLHTSL